METIELFSSFFDFFCCKQSRQQHSNYRKNLRFYENFRNTKELLSIEITKVTNDQKSLLGGIETYLIKVVLDDFEYFIEKKLQEFIYFKEKLLKIHPKTVFELPTKDVYMKIDSELVQTRQKTLNLFLKKIQEIFKKKPCIEIMNFLQIFENYKENKTDVIVDSYNLYKLKSFYTAKDDAELIDLLVKLNDFQNDRIFFFNKIKELMLGEELSISAQIKEILLNGFYNLQGLIDICGGYSSDPHIVCCVGLGLLHSLCDYEQNKEAEIYINLFSKLSAKDFSKLNLGAHIVLSPSKNCKKYALKLLELYKESNPQANSFLFSQILNNDEAYNQFEKWKSSSTIISQKTEFLDFDLEDCRISNLPMMTNTINIGKSEEGKKKIRSTLYRQKKKDQLFIPVKIQSN